MASAIEKSGLDFAKPVFIVAECVLVYMEVEFSNALVKWLGERCATSALVVRTFQIEIQYWVVAQW